MDEQNCATSNGIASKLSKPKAFLDCSIEEKVLRLHAEISNQRYTIRYLQRINEELVKDISRLKSHSHGTNGNVLIDLKELDRCGQGVMGDCAMGVDYLA